MITLYQRENCPFCKKVREWLGEHNISYMIKNVEKLAARRTEVLELAKSDEVPLLEDDGTIVKDSDLILGYLNEKFNNKKYNDPSYGLTQRINGKSLHQVQEDVTKALMVEGFGVLTEIDVKSTLKKKIGVDFRPYVILGACNPKFAHEALQAEPAIGLLLPCNVIITEEQDGEIVVSTIDPMQMFKIITNQQVSKMALEVRKKLINVLESIL